MSKSMQKFDKIIRSIISYLSLISCFMVFMYYLNFITGYFWNLDSSVFTFLLWDWKADRDTGLGW